MHTEIASGTLSGLRHEAPTAPPVSSHDRHMAIVTNTPLTLAVYVPDLSGPGATLRWQEPVEVLVTAEWSAPVGDRQFRTEGLDIKVRLVEWVVHDLNVLRDGQRPHEPGSEGDIVARPCTVHDNCLVVFISWANIDGSPFEGIKWDGGTHVAVSGDNWSEPVTGLQTPAFAKAFQIKKVTESYQVRYPK